MQGAWLRKLRGKTWWPVLVVSFVLIAYSSISAAIRLHDVAYIIANLVVALLALGWAKRRNLSDVELGTQRDQLWSGLRWGGIPASVIVTVVIGATLIFSNQAEAVASGVSCNPNRPETLLDLIWEVGPRLLLGTALAEELLFRGALLAAWRQALTALKGLHAMSVAFALWHIGPTIANEMAKPESCRTEELVCLVMATMLAMYVAGLILGWLRDDERGRGFLAPLLVHWSVNGSLITAAYLAA